MALPESVVVGDFAFLAVDRMISPFVDGVKEWGGISNASIVAFYDDDDDYGGSNFYTATTTIGSDSASMSSSSSSSHRSLSGEVRIGLYAVIFLLALSGNSLVIVTLVQNKRMRTITNVFLLNLSISDLLLAVFCMPFTLVPTLMKDFVFGKAMCILVRYMQGISNNSLIYIYKYIYIYIDIYIYIYIIRIHMI